MQEFIDRLFSSHSTYPNGSPRLSDGKKFTERVLGLFFPHHAKYSFEKKELISAEFETIESILKGILGAFSKELPRSEKEIASAFVEKLPSFYEMLCRDAQAMFAGDPAARSIDEVIVAYPGFYAVAAYRIANYFYKESVPVFPRVITEHAHQLTGIDIHPGATIGEHFCIDHGTGIVIGETTVIRNNVKIYQGVTLGALSVEKSLADKKRHPTIEDNVVIYAHATILGGETVIGKDSVIGGNVWITSSVAPSSVVYHFSEQKIKNRNNS